MGSRTKMAASMGPLSTRPCNCFGCNPLNTLPLSPLSWRMKLSRTTVSPAASLERPFSSVTGR